MLSTKYKTTVLSGNVDQPSTSPSEKVTHNNSRLASLDFYRGLVMVLLMVESTGLYDHLINGLAIGSFGRSLAIQFTHAPWHGLHFWDLIQPAFMFIAGTAMAFSLTRQTAKGILWKNQAFHAVKRSWWLFFWGVFIYAVRGNHLSFELWNVLTQMSFTMLLAFLIFKWRPGYQILLSIGLLILTEFLYRFTNIPGFDQPFTDQHNFGNYVDLLLMNKTNTDGWVAINCLPTAAHTIWGAVAGKWLLSEKDINHKPLIFIVIFGAVTLLTGYSLDIAGITPIIKRIATSSFTLVTGGWCLLALAFLYLWIDVWQHKRFLKFFTIVGMNSIFIYLFFEIVVSHWLYDYINIIVSGILPSGLSKFAVMVLASFVIFIIEWYLCYWLYKKKIFFKV
jgi:predicted acyltransferase